MVTQMMSRNWRDLIRPKAITLDPKDAWAHCAMGLAYRDQGRLEEAIAEFEQAIALDPKLADAHINLGNVYKNQERQEDAIAEYKRVVEAD